MSDIDAANPKFQAWLAARPDQLRKEVDAKLVEIAAQPDIAQDHATGTYCRLHRLMSWCAETHGYDFS